MGKGTKKKTVWRTFSFENGYTNGNDATATATVAATNTATATATATSAAHTTNGFNVPHHHQHRQLHHKQKYGKHNSFETIIEHKHILGYTTILA